MSRKKKARPDAATSRRAGQEKQQASGNSYYKHTSQGPGGQQKIATLLSHGQENAIPRRHLEKLTGRDGRTIRLMIERERREGVPILSDNSAGYYLPGNEGERERFVRSMRHRAQEIERAAEAVEQAEG